MKHFFRILPAIFGFAMLLSACQSPTNNAKLITSLSELQRVETIFVPTFTGDPNYGDKTASVFANTLESALKDKGVTGIQVLRGNPRMVEGRLGPQSVVQGKAYSNHNEGFFEGFAIVNLNTADTGATQVSISRPSKSKRGDTRWGVLESATKLAAVDLAASIAGEGAN